jgi:hypothetical protein
MQKVIIYSMDGHFFLFFHKNNHLKGFWAEIAACKKR